MLISCDGCSGRMANACGDCVVTYLTTDDHSSVVVDLATQRAIRLLVEAGMVATGLDRDVG